jgi:hypothetical protein
MHPVCDDHLLGGAGTVSDRTARCTAMREVLSGDVAVAITPWHRTLDAILAISPGPGPSPHPHLLLVRGFAGLGGARATRQRAVGRVVSCDVPRAITPRRRTPGQINIDISGVSFFQVSIATYQQYSILSLLQCQLLYPVIRIYPVITMPGKYPSIRALL